MQFALAELVLLSLKVQPVQISDDAEETHDRKLMSRCNYVAGNKVQPDQSKRFEEAGGMA